MTPVAGRRGHAHRCAGRWCADAGCIHPAGVSVDAGRSIRARQSTARPLNWRTTLFEYVHLELTSLEREVVLTVRIKERRPNP
ncbi:MAG: hypothetical protein MZV64_31610 [Ignavibacteriales bacterium]|nr:hypothetical protein [Ignavibacteriales bacterium]